LNFLSPHNLPIPLSKAGACLTRRDFCKLRWWLDWNFGIRAGLEQDDELCADITFA
jgi:hypothetical protein